MILVTGAGGKTGRAVTSALAARGCSVRALVRRAEQEPVLRELGAVEVVVGNMRHGSTWSRALSGVRACYLICPNVNPDELSIAQLALKAANAERVEHFVYHSVLHPQTEAMPHHWLKLRVEERLLDSGVECTILQPSAYMQNLLPQWSSIMRHGEFRVPYAIDTKLGMVDLTDVAEAAAVVLTESGHTSAIYELCGPDRLTQTQVAEALSIGTGKSVVAHRITLAEWQREARNSGISSYAISTLVQMFEYYEQHGFWGNPRVLGWLLGREPRTLDEFITSTMHEWSASTKE